MKRFFILTLYFCSLTAFSRGCDVAEELTKERSDFYRDQVNLTIKNSSENHFDRYMKLYFPARIYLQEYQAWYVSDSMYSIQRLSMVDDLGFVVTMPLEFNKNNAVSEFSLHKELLSESYVHFSYSEANSVEPSCGFSLEYSLQDLIK